MTNKYGAKATVVNGIRFASAKEARRYQELLLLQKAGEIDNIELQPEYVLVYPFVYNGVKYRGVKYRADFRYRVVKNGTVDFVVEDSKGFKNAVYKIKKQMLLSMYPKINFVEM